MGTYPGQTSNVRSSMLVMDITAPVTGVFFTGMVHFCVIQAFGAANPMAGKRFCAGPQLAVG